MKKAFLDTNILVDLIADRKPFSNAAIAIFKMAEQNAVQLFTSSHSIATTHYLLKKYIDEEELRTVLLKLLEVVILISVDTDTIRRSLRSIHKDFEDSIQIHCAYKVEGMDFIITRNKKDFKDSEVTVLAPDEFVLRR